MSISHNVMDMCDAQFLFFFNLLPISIFFRLVKNQKKKINMKWASLLFDCKWKCSGLFVYFIIFIFKLKFLKPTCEIARFGLK